MNAGSKGWSGLRHDGLLTRQEMHSDWNSGCAELGLRSHSADFLDINLKSFQCFRDDVFWSQ
jgi:hypothetical protein